MTAAQMDKAKKIIKKHYNLDRDLTEKEVTDEIDNIKRKGTDVLYISGIKDLYSKLNKASIISYSDLTK